jgi:hypothetical protein
VSKHHVPVRVEFKMDGPLAKGLRVGGLKLVRD